MKRIFDKIIAKQSVPLELLYEVPDINLKKQDDPEKGCTALVLACGRYANVETVDRLLLLPSIDVNMQAGKFLDQTALIDACRYKNTQIVKKLLSRNDIDVNKQAHNGETALNTAIVYKNDMLYRDNDDIIDMLLARDDINVNIQGIFDGTPLMSAISKYNTRVAKMLLKKGAYPNLRKKNNDTALIMASRNGLEDIVLDLLYLGADENAVNKDGESMDTYLDNLPRIKYIKEIKSIIDESERVPKDITSLITSFLFKATKSKKKSKKKLKKSSRKRKSIRK